MKATLENDDRIMSITLQEALRSGEWILESHESDDCKLTLNLVRKTRRRKDLGQI